MMVRDVRFLVVSVALLSIVGAEACADDGDEDLAASGAQRLEQVALGPATWARCWFASNGADEAFLRAYELFCSAPESSDYPLPAKVTVFLVDARDGQSHAVLEPGKTSSVGVVFANKLPLRVQVSASFDEAAAARRGIASRIEPNDFRLIQAVARPEDITSDRPLVATQPFALWPVTIVQRTSAFTLRPESLDAVSAAPFVLGLEKKATYRVENGTLVGAPDRRERTVYLVAPAQGSVGATYATLGSGGEQTVRIDGPGLYVAEDHTLRKATEGERP